jgi:hypothetical protein
VGAGEARNSYKLGSFFFSFELKPKETLLIDAGFNLKVENSLKES